jgi:Tol biopolymer transport system component
MVVSVADKSVRRLTPDSEDKYKEGLEWHPDSKRLTYFYYGPEKYSAKMKWAFLDQPGRVEEMFDQEGHWDYVGVWAPDGRHFHFTSSPDAQDHKNIHVFDAQTGQFIHGLRDGYRPEWSRDGRTMVWGAGGRDRYFEVIENFARSE